MTQIRQKNYDVPVITDITSANGTDLATTQTLANEIKVDLNLVLAQLRKAGIIR